MLPHSFVRVELRSVVAGKLLEPQSMGSSAGEELLDRPAAVYR
jgi:hypothetical protein